MSGVLHATTLYSLLLCIGLLSYLVKYENMHAVNDRNGSALVGSSVTSVLILGLNWVRLKWSRVKRNQVQRTACIM